MCIRDSSNTVNAISSRSLTSDFVRWEVPAWNVYQESSTAQQSADLSPIIQAVINRSGFVSGNSIAIVVSGTGKRVAESFEGSPAEAAELCITYGEESCVIGYPCDDGDNQTGNDIYDADCNCKGEENVLLAKVFLEGFYDAAAGQMHRQLPANNLLPLAQPFNTAPWNYSGTETVASIPLGVTDWVLVMSRAGDGTPLSQAAGFVNQAGELLSLDGSKGIVLDQVNGNYVSIHHRSHLAIISAQPYEGSELDFTTAVNLVQGNAAMKNVNGRMCLYAGDYDATGIINSVDFNDWKIQGAILNQYLPIDGDGNGIVNNKDYNLWIRNRSKVGEPVVRY